jgi:GNAT superfamily N-acetyltransferase
MTIVYRRAHIEDLDVVTELFRKLYAERHTVGKILEENKLYLVNPTQAMFLAYDGEIPVGAAHAAKRVEYVEGSHGDICGYLEAVYTELEYRLRGVAKGLVAECEKWSLGQGCTMFASDCELENADSLKFHLAVGFSEASRNIHFAKPLSRGTPMYYVLPLTDEYRTAVDKIAAATWGGGKIAAHGELYELANLPCYIAVSDSGEIFGYCYYRLDGRDCEIMALESLCQNVGAATPLMNTVRGVAEENRCGRVYLETSNDNTHAFRFYQRRGFVISEIRINGMDIARRLKPSIPLAGEEGLPLRDEIEFEMRL